MRYMSCAILLAGMLTGACANAVEQERFTMKEGEAQTGTRLKRENAVSSLPFDKSYRELSAEQQRKVKSAYANMAEDDEPPFPEKGLAGLFSALQKVHAKVPVRGKLDLEAEVDAEGKVVNVLIYESPDEWVTKVMAAALATTKFKPALCHGQPCAQNFPFLVNMTIRY